MKCEKCGGEWIPPKGLSVSLANCPFCGTPLLNTETAGGYTEMSAFLEYLISLYGSELYKDSRKLNNLISDLYRGDERMKRVYRRAMLDDTLSIKVYELSLKPINERMAFYDKLISNFAEVNFYSQEFGKQIVDSFVKGLKLEILPPISTEATEEDGEWIDEFGVKYSADRKKLIEGNSDLTSYNIKEGTVVICDEAFCCWNLKSITIPSSVTNIGKMAFMNCKVLESITIPSSVTTIGDNAFGGCTNLHLKVENNPYYYVEGNILYTKKNNILLWCPKDVKKVIIPSSITSIENDAFSGCSRLNNIIIPPSVINIGKEVFDGCYSLNNIIIPPSVISIGNGAFRGCTALERITIPSSVTSIGDCTFNDCYSLRNIIIPSSVVNIRNSAFADCRVLTSITIPSSVTSIGDYAFSSCEALKSITIPSSVTSIGHGAFSCCFALESITIPSSVTNIEDWTFHGCMALTSIDIPSSVTSIGGNAFLFCTALESINIPSSVISIGDDAFKNCEALESILIPKGSSDKFKNLLPSKLHQYLKETDS